MPEEKLLLVREVAETLRVNRSTVYRMIDAGLVEAIRPSPNVLRIPETELQRILSDRTAEITIPRTRESHRSQGLQRS